MQKTAQQIKHFMQKNAQNPKQGTKKGPRRGPEEEQKAGSRGLLEA